MKNSTVLTKLTNEGNRLDIETNGAKFQVYLLDENIIRIRSTFEKDFAPELSYALVKTAWDDAADKLLSNERMRVEALPITVDSSEDGTYSLSNGNYRLEISSEPFGFTILDKAGNILHKDLPGRSFLKDDLGRIYHYTSIGDEDRFYGFGEKSGTLDKNRRRMRMHNTDSLGWDASKTDPLYKMIPFYIDFDSERNLASGLFYNNSSDSVFDMAAERSNYWRRYSYFQADGGDIDLFFIGGPTIKDVVEHYTDLTGKTAMMPLSSLGYMGSTMFYTEFDNADKAIENFVDTCAKYGIPCDGFFLSSGYSSSEDEQGHRYVFNWNKKRFPDPKQFVNALKQKGVLVAPNIKPGMLNDHYLTEEMIEGDAFIKDAEGDGPAVERFWGGPAHFVDFTSPRGREMWAKHTTDSLLSIGITSLWDDNNEYEINDNEAQIDAEGQHKTIGEFKPLMSTLMAKTAHLALNKYDPSVRPYVVSRAGFAGIQRYAQTWAGDNSTSWTSLKYNIPTILGMGLSGVANQGCDIGGFDGPAPEPELFVRWVQNGIFQPRFSIHSANNDNTVTEPWMYPEYTHYIKDAIQLRYTLVPYMYSLLFEASISGAPILRPLVYEFQNDPNVTEESFEFMLGPSILVANVVDKGATTKTVYLPQGTQWLDLNTRKYYDGGTTLTVPVDLGSIPLFLRTGSIIPRSPGLMNIHNEPIDHLDLLIEPSADTSFQLYEDDGTTNNYKSGGNLITRIAVSSSPDAVSIRFAKSGSYQSKVHKIALSVYCRSMAPLTVRVGGRSIQRFLNFEDFQKVDEGWFFDGENRLARIKYKNPDERDYEADLLFAVKDLISI